MPISGICSLRRKRGLAVRGMAWCVEQGIITGVTDTSLDPQGSATRAQCAAMLMRFVESA